VLQLKQPAFRRATTIARADWNRQI